MNKEMIGEPADARSILFAVADTLGVPHGEIPIEAQIAAQDSLIGERIRDIKATETAIDYALVVKGDK